MKELTADTNLDEEVTHLAAFIGQKWTPIANIEALFTEIRDAALHAARGWIDQHAIWELASEMEDRRANLLKSTLAAELDVGVEFYDALCTLLYAIGRDAKHVRDAALALDGEWDFSRRSNRVELSLSAKYPDLAAARPFGWAELEKDYCDFYGQEAYQPREDRALFKGSNVPGLLSPSFTSRVALPYVMYDEKCQGLKANRVLVGAVFAHFLGIAEHLNTLELKRAIQKAFSDIEKPEMLFERKIKTDNKILNVLLELAGKSPTKEEFEKAVAAKAEFDALSDEDKAARKSKNQKKLVEMLEELKANPKENQKQDDEAQRCLTLMRAAFPS